VPPNSADQSLRRLCGLRTRQWPLDVDTYLLRAAAAALLLRGARLLFRPRAIVRRFVKRELLDSENISHAMPAAMRSEAIFFIRIGRMPSPRPRVFRPSSRCHALGQKQTFAVHQPMSALPPKADIDQRSDLISFQSSIVSFEATASKCSKPFASLA
jgi:hypothetical protein